MPASDQLDANRQPVRSGAGWQGQARHRELRPWRIKDGRPGVGEGARRLTWRRRGQDRIETAGPFARGGARLLGGTAGGAELFEGELAAERQFFLAQPRAQQGLVAVELGHVIAQPLKGAEGALDLV